MNEIIHKLNLSLKILKIIITLAKWTSLVDFLVHLVWNEIPEKLLVWGIFTDLDGQFPLPHYMWICPAIFGGVSDSNRKKHLLWYMNLA